MQMKNINSQIAENIAITNTKKPERKTSRSGSEKRLQRMNSFRKQIIQQQQNEIMCIDVQLETDAQSLSSSDED
eukprot:Pgem_evm1s11555